MVFPIAAAVTLAWAQNYPHPETILSGIDIYKASAQEVERKFGNPITIKDGQRYSNKIRTYEWQNGHTRLRIVRLAEGQSSSINSGIFSIDVWGNPDPAGVGVTGEGLRLGDQLKDAKRIYGSRLKNGTPSGFGSEPLLGGFRASVMTGADSPTLEIEFDKAGRITHLKLVNPCVPFCW